MSRSERLKLLSIRKTLQKEAGPDKVVEVVKGLDGKDGTDGAAGKDGRTPVKGKDYFDGQDGTDGRDGKDGRHGKDGKPGKDGANGKSLVWRGQWISGRDYRAGDVIYNQGSSFICKNPHTSSRQNEPPLSPNFQAFWDPIAIKGDQGLGGANGTNASGGGGAVSSVNGLTGVVVLDTSNVSDTTNKRYVTDAQQVTLGNTSGINTGDQDLSGLLVKSNNLSDLTNVATARTNLGLVSGGAGDIWVEKTGDTMTGNLLLTNTGVFLGLQTSAPTHSLTLGSTATGIALYNTSDQTTNYERMLMSWNTNIFTISTQLGGTGTARSLRMQTANSRSITIVDGVSTSGTYQFAIGSSAGNYNSVVLAGTISSSSGIVAPLAITPTIAQSSTAGYTALLINSTESSVGSGAKLLIDAQVGGITQFSIANNGAMNVLGGITTRNVTPASTTTYNLGSTSGYYSNLYARTQNFNSTASMDGTVAGAINTTGLFGILATSATPTHSLTLGSTATGIALYNTSDQTTNFERVLMQWTSNAFVINSSLGGTGTQRTLQLQSGGNNFISISNAQGGAVATPKVLIGAGSTSVAFPVAIVSTLTSTTAVQNSFSIAPTINQSSTGGYTALLINITESALGSGAKSLLDLQVGSTSKFKISNTGKITMQTGNADSSVGSGTLAAGTATINTTAVTASSKIILTDSSGSTGQLSVGTIVAGTSFVVNSSLITDTSTFNWLIIN